MGLGMILPLFIAAIIFVVFFWYLIAIALNDILYILVNGIIFTVIYVRLFGEMYKKRIFKPYTISLGITTVVFFALFDFIIIPFIWWPVWFIVVFFVLGELIQWAPKLVKKE